MAAIELYTFRYTGGGVTLSPSSSSSLRASIPNDDTGTTARYIVVQMLNSSAGLGFPAGTINIGTSSTVTASSADFGITANTPYVFDVRGQSWLAVWGYTANCSVSIAPHQRG